MDILSIQGKTFKQYLNTKYYCDENGNIYSEFSHKILKPLRRKSLDKEYYYVDINFGEGQKHIPIHRIVYTVWIGDIPEDMNVLHKDDNSLNNNFNNLYLGTIQQNTFDRINNGHNVGNSWILTIYDKKTQKTITFCPAQKFIEYSEHSCQNGNVKRMFSRNWFKKRFEVIDYYRCKNLKIKESVTTMEDECTPVEQKTLLLEAHSSQKMREEIV